MEYDKKEKIETKQGQPQVKKTSKKIVIVLITIFALIICASTICIGVGILKTNDTINNINKELGYQREQLYQVNTNLSDIQLDLSGIRGSTMQHVVSYPIKEIKFEKDDTTTITLTSSSTTSWGVRTTETGFIAIYEIISNDVIQYKYYLPMDRIYYIEF